MAIGHLSQMQRVKHHVTPCIVTCTAIFLMLKVVEIEEDISILVENDNFLFDEQVIQDDRLVNLEERALNLENRMLTTENDVVRG